MTKLAIHRQNNAAKRFRPSARRNLSLLELVVFVVLITSSRFVNADNSQQNRRDYDSFESLAGEKDAAKDGAQVKSYYLQRWLGGVDGYVENAEPIDIVEGTTGRESIVSAGLRGAGSGWHKPRGNRQLHKQKHERGMIRESSGRTEHKKGSKSKEASKSSKGSKSKEGSISEKGTKSAKGSKSKEGSKSKKGSKSVKGSKSKKSVKGSKSKKSIKGSKSKKSMKGNKSKKSVKGSKSKKSVKGSKSKKSVKGSKSKNSEKDSKFKEGSKSKSTAVVPAEDPLPQPTVTTPAALSSKEPLVKKGIITFLELFQ